MAAFDAAPDDELRVRLHSCCAAEAWVEQMVAGRPYRSEAALYAASDRATAELDAARARRRRSPATRASATPLRRTAVTGVPPPGRGASRRASPPPARTCSASSPPPTPPTSSGSATSTSCAPSGRGAAELLAVCRARLDNDPETERGVVLGELAKINRLRLGKLLEEPR